MILVRDYIFFIQMNEYLKNQDKELSEELLTEYKTSTINVPNINIEQDLISKYLTNFMEDVIKRECWDVKETLGYNLFGF